MLTHAQVRHLTGTQESSVCNQKRLTPSSSHCGQCREQVHELLSDDSLRKSQQDNKSQPPRAPQPANTRTTEERMQSKPARPAMHCPSLTMAPPGCLLSRARQLEHFRAVQKIVSQSCSYACPSLTECHTVEGPATASQSTRAHFEHMFALHSSSNSSSSSPIWASHQCVLGQRPPPLSLTQQASVCKHSHESSPTKHARQPTAQSLYLLCQTPLAHTTCKLFESPAPASNYSPQTPTQSSQLS